LGPEAQPTRRHPKSPATAQGRTLGQAARARSRNPVLVCPVNWSSIMTSNRRGATVSPTTRCSAT